MLLLSKCICKFFVAIVLLGICILQTAQAETDGYYCTKLISSVNQNISGASVSLCQEFRMQDGSNRKEVIANILFPKEELNIDYTKWNQPTDSCAFTTWNPSVYQNWWRKLPATFWSDFEQYNEIESSVCNQSFNSLFPLPSCLYYQDFSKVSYAAKVSSTILDITSYSNYRCPLTADNTRSEMVRFYTKKSSQIDPPIEVQPPKPDCKELKELYLVKNKGIPSNNSRDLLNRLQSSVIDEAPKIVVLLVGTNDILNNVQPGKLLSIAKYKANVSQIIDKVKECSDIVIGTIPPVDAKIFSGRTGIKNPNKKISNINNEIKKLAIQKNIPVIDINSEFNRKKYRETNPKKPIYTIIGKDGLHPNEKGYKVISDMVYNALKVQNLPNEGIICFGDSITKGVDGNNHSIRSYPTQLEGLLSK